MKITLDHLLIPGSEPFFYPGGEIGCLCVHGLTATPQEVRWLGQFLADQGYTVYGPRLAGHGTQVQLMEPTRWLDWYASVQDAYSILRPRCRQIFVLGLSMGGLLALLLAIHQPAAGVVVMASPLELPNPILPYARTIKWAMPYVYKTPDRQMEAHLRETQEARAEPIVGRAAYGSFPTSSLAEFNDLMAFTAQKLPRLAKPLLLIYSTADRTVPLRNQGLIAGLVSTPAADLHQMTLHQSGHLLTLDREREKVFAAAAEFIKIYAVGREF